MNPPRWGQPSQGNGTSAPNRQRFFLEEDLIEDFWRNEGLLVQTMPAKQELLLRRNDSLWPMGHGWRVLKELAATFRPACCSISPLLLESLSLIPPYLTSNSQEAVRIVQAVNKGIGGNTSFVSGASWKFWQVMFHKPRCTIGCSYCIGLCYRTWW